ncbi:peptide-methionine (S)-S-oxide reductase [Salegentibacter sp. JZCK2]|uniref:peptide-methionine (S)-S-oxide reductase n=1 Tax=Salegentibacter tibetensis TaxID=2873600 RepID=UPI001CCCA973|nr:peptide-methionine (S)-S-oxide reductase [Salegentibacter tibetensis]MBZ9729713.1 peptide-methionine (S)-S-oxide reductase [Salegentibacter tibetensis]
MSEKFEKIAFGGGCHWCTEAVFQQIIGVKLVEQGYIASTGKDADFSEAVIVHFNNKEIPLARLIEIHLHTHQSTSSHSMREKYRSAVYYFDKSTKEKASEIILNLQSHFEEEIITKVLPFALFEASRKEIQNYYQKGPDRPFCRNFIHPKLSLLRKKFFKDLA